MRQRADRIEARIAPEFRPYFGAYVADDRRLESGLPESFRNSENSFAFRSIDLGERETIALDVTDDARSLDRRRGSGSAEASYYTWVDQHDTFGLGRNVPIATGNASDALLALVDGKFVVLRVPYPMGFYAKGMDGRIDDENAGWKGKGLWATYGTRTPFHVEGGKGTTSKVVRFQLRPDPLTR
jgi:hypothetical protein